MGLTQIRYTAKRYGPFLCLRKLTLRLLDRYFVVDTPSDKVQISNDGRKYYFVEVCDDGSCHVIEPYGEEAEQLRNEATSIRNKYKFSNSLI